MASKIFTKSELKRLLIEYGGNVNRMATDLGISRQTVYNHVRDFGLYEIVVKSRKHLHMVAVGNLLAAVEDGDLETSKFVVKHHPGPERWSSRQEVVIGSFAIAEDVMQMAAELNIDMSDVAAGFEEMIRQQHKAKVAK